MVDHLEVSPQLSRFKGLQETENNTACQSKNAPPIKPKLRAASLLLGHHRWIKRLGAWCVIWYSV